MKNPNTCKICLFVDLILFISLKTVCENSGILVLELVVGSAEEEVKMLTFLLWKYFLVFQQIFHIFKPIKSGLRIHDNISVVLVVGQKSTFVRFNEHWI